MIELTHSPLGGSALEAYRPCPGTIALAKQLAPADDADQPEYTQHGVLAHMLLERCLREGVDLWELPEPTTLPEAMLPGVTLGIGYCRSLPGEHHIEASVSHPEFHPAMFGRADFIASGRDGFEVVDFKNGAGVIVEATGNQQLRFYAFGALEGGRMLVGVPDEMPVKLTIIQPNAPHPSGPIRSEMITVGDLRRWAYTELLPTMQATERDQYLSVGSHCRFRPCRFVCPAGHGLTKAFAGEPVAELQILANERLAHLYSLVEPAKIFLKALEDEVRNRNLAGNTVPGTKLVEGRTNRVWKDGAEAEARGAFGERALTEPELKSPVQMEALGPHGKMFATRWAYKPAGNPVVALASDKRPSIQPQTAAIVFKDFVDATE